MFDTAPEGKLTPDYPYAELKEDVENIPAWAERFEIGDTIRWHVEPFEDVQESEVVGFSSLYAGLPVIAPPEPPESGESFPTTESVTVSKDHWAGSDDAGDTTQDQSPNTEDANP